MAKKKRQDKQVAVVPESSPRKAVWPWVLLGLTLLLIAILRIRMLNVPLERDEGEYAYAGQLILQGVPPYKLAYNMKFPGVYAAYALLMAVFGQTTAGVHLGFMMVNLLTIVLVFVLARRLLGDAAAVAAAASYGVFSISIGVLGLAAHATHFVVAAAVGGAIVLLKAVENGKPPTFFWSGVLFGLSVMMKQHAAFFVVFGLLYTVWALSRTGPRRFRTIAVDTASYLAGSVVPFGVTCAILAATGVFDNFWYWTFQYASQYASRLPLQFGIVVFQQAFPGVVGSAALLWVAGALGLVVLAVDKKIRPQLPFIAGFAVFSALAVIPGFYFRGHYFVQFLPALALLIGASVRGAVDIRAGTLGTPIVRSLVALVFVLLLSQAILGQREILFSSDPTFVSRSIYGANPFPESVEVSKYIKARTGPEDVIAVIASEPQIYFYTGRRSATGYIYTYPLMEDQKYADQMQNEMIDEIEKGKPKYIVYGYVGMSWLRTRDSDTHIIEWADEYLRKYYDQVGLADIVSTEFEPYTDYYWDEDAAGRRAQADNKVIVYRRKG